MMIEQYTQILRGQEMTKRKSRSTLKGESRKEESLCAGKEEARAGRDR